MKRLSSLAVALALMTSPCFAQSLEDLDIQIHGYATQGFLYTTNNNIFTTTSSNGSPAWTEAVVNISSQPSPKLRVAVQGRYELLGNYANQITIDYAIADYKQNDLLGLRFGKVKIPSGLFNEIQDVDPSYMWALLPQSIYPIASRNGQLSLYGGVVYGVMNGGKAGKLEYRGWSGENVIAANDGYLTSLVELGFTYPNGLTGIQNGLALHWKTPIRGLMIGASNTRKNRESVPVTSPYGAAVFNGSHANAPYFFGKYEKSRLLVAAEYNRLAGNYGFQFAGPITPLASNDTRHFYVMSTYKVTEKLNVGIYDSQENNHTPHTPLGPAKYSKDWTFSSRYDFNQYLYAKAEEHLIRGTFNDYDADLNLAGLQPNTKLTVVKVGVSF